MGPVQHVPTVKHQWGRYSMYQQSNTSGAATACTNSQTPVGPVQHVPTVKHQWGQHSLFNLLWNIDLVQEEHWLQFIKTVDICHLTTKFVAGGGIYEHNVHGPISWYGTCIYVTYTSLVPRPRPAFRRLQYRKWRTGLGTRLHVTLLVTIKHDSGVTLSLQMD